MSKRRMKGEKSMFCSQCGADLVDGVCPNCAAENAQVTSEPEYVEVEPKKKKNEHNRLRDVIVNFRVSPKEKALIDARIAATGMGKQDYFRQSSLYQKILVKGNIRTFAAIRRDVLELSEKLDKNPDLTSLDPADAERLKTILEILNYLF